jgi:hypothetical protein
MIACALAALKGLSIVRWCWANRGLLKWLVIGLVIAALTGLWRWERHDRISAEKTEQAAEIARSFAAADAQRWHAASDERDAALAGLSDALARQNAAVTKLQFSLERADRAAAQAERESQEARGRFDQRVKELEDEAKVHPENVVPLGGIVRGRVARLWD